MSRHFNTETINTRSFYSFAWIEKNQPPENVDGVHAKNWRVPRTTLKRARASGDLIVCPDKPTFVRGDHLLDYLKGKTRRKPRAN